MLEQGATSRRGELWKNHGLMFSTTHYGVHREKHFPKYYFIKDILFIYSRGGKKKMPSHRHFLGMHSQKWALLCWPCVLIPLLYKVGLFAKASAQETLTNSWNPVGTTGVKRALSFEQSYICCSGVLHGRRGKGSEKGGRSQAEGGQKDCRKNCGCRRAL